MTDLSPALRGSVIFIVSGLVFTANDALTKALVSNVPVADVIWGRHIAYLVAVIAVAGRRHPRRLFVSSHRWTQVGRGLAMFGATATFFLALSLLPLIGAKSITGSSLALAQRPKAGAGRGATGVWTSVCMARSLFRSKSFRSTVRL